MAVYVDTLLPCPKSTRWPYAESCRLFTDVGNVDALHVLAQRIGLRRGWFRDDGAMPHYDLTRGKRAQAVEVGAVELDRKEWVQIYRQWKRLRKGNVQ